MMTCWTSFLQSRLDYCSQLWSPHDQSSITNLEDVARQYTSHIDGMEGLNYWERLYALGMYSQERRRERYMIIFMWKIAIGMVEGYQMEFLFNHRRRWVAVPKPVSRTAPACVRKAREASFAVKGALLFNLCPRGLRDLASDHVDRFKANLDAWLLSIPDQPTIAGCQRAANSNSLLHQVPMMMQQLDPNCTELE